MTTAYKTFSVPFAELNSTSISITCTGAPVIIRYASPTFPLIVLSYVPWIFAHAFSKIHNQKLPSVVLEKTGLLVNLSKGIKSSTTTV